jgi:lipid A 3-O-deacylase
LKLNLEGVVFVAGANEAKCRKARADWISGKVTWVMLATLMIIGLSVEWAYSNESELKPSPSPETIWVDGIGSGFRKGLFRAGVAVGAGFGTRVFDTTLAHDFAMGSVNLGWVFTGAMASDKWYRGNLELLAEVFGGYQFKPNGRYFVGLTPLIRYNLATGSRWVPFLNVGAGVSRTNIDGPDLSGNFQFNIQVGAGTHYFLSDRTALTVEYRWLHFSNADTREPNNGTNTQMFHVGVSWFF